MLQTVIKIPSEIANEVEPLLQAEGDRLNLQEILQGHDELKTSLLGLLGQHTEKLDQLLRGQTEIKSLLQPQQHLPRHNLPAAYETFLGRDEELKNLKQRLNDNQITLLLQGLGGIGKTTLATQVGHALRDDFDFIFWLTVEGDLERSLTSHPHLSSLPALAGQSQFQAILQYLNPPVPQRLLILDNLTLQQDVNNATAWFPGAHLLFTSRQGLGIPDPYPVGVLAPKDAMALFLHHSKQKGVSDPDLSPLLEAAGRHTLMVEMLGKTFYCSEIKTLAPLLTAMNRHQGDDAAFKEQIKCHYQGQRPQGAELTLYSQLFSLYDHASLSVEEQHILRQFAILQSEFHPASLWATVMGVNQNEEALATFKRQCNTLADKGWLLQEGANYRCHQVVQQSLWLRPETRPSLEQCDKTLDALGGLLQYSENLEFLHGLPFVPFGEAAWAAFKEQPPQPEEQGMGEGRWGNYAALGANLGAVLKELGQYQAALACQVGVLDLHRKLLFPQDPLLANSLNNLGTSLMELGRRDEALKAALAAIKIGEASLPPLDPKLAIWYNNLATIYHARSELDLALTALEKALAIDQAQPLPNKAWIAIRHNNLAAFYFKKGDPESALKSQQQCIALEEKLLQPNDPSLATSYHNLGTYHYDLGQGGQAFAEACKAWGIRSHQLPLGHPDTEATLQGLELLMKEFSPELDPSQMEQIKAEIQAYLAKQGKA